MIMSARLKNIFRKAKKSPEYRKNARLAAVAADLRILIAEQNEQYQAIAERIGISAAGLSKQLSGTANLTLESIGEICDAIGKDFDVVFRAADVRRALQPWEKQAHEEDVLQLRDYALMCAKEADALLDTARAVRNVAWNRAQQGRAEGREATKTYQWTMNDDTFAVAAAGK